MRKALVAVAVLAAVGMLASSASAQTWRDLIVRQADGRLIKVLLPGEPMPAFAGPEYTRITNYDLTLLPPEVSLTIGRGKWTGTAVVLGWATGRLPEQPDGLRTGLGTIFAGTAAQKRVRMLDVVEKYPPLGTALTLLRGALTPDARAFVFEATTRVKAKIGTGATEILTQTEYDALKALAAQRGLEGLVP